jgi:hypothetical protein
MCQLAVRELWLILNPAWTRGKKNVGPIRHRSTVPFVSQRSLVPVRTPTTKVSNPDSIGPFAGQNFSHENRVARRVSSNSDRIHASNTCRRVGFVPAIIFTNSHLALNLPFMPPTKAEIRASNQVHKERPSTGQTPSGSPRGSLLGHGTMSLSPGGGAFPLHLQRSWNSASKSHRD